MVGMSNMDHDKKLAIIVAGAAVGVTTMWVLYRLFAKRARSPPKLLEDPEKKYEIELAEKKILSRDTRLFRYKLPSPDHVLGLPTGQHIYLTARVNNQLVIRPYTPVSSDEDRGHVDLVIKVYFKNVHPKFPDGGKLTQYMEDMKIGDKIQVRGPNGLLVYKGRGQFAIRPDKKAPPVVARYKKVGMIAGGSGITPMLQIVRHVFRDPKDTTQLWMLFANQTEEDILLKKELEEVRDAHPEQFHLWYTVDRPSTDWRYSSGFVSSEMIQKHLPAPSDDTIILMCGPPPMINFACVPNLDKLGYSPRHRFAY